MTGEGAAHAAATLWAREGVLAQARGETLPETYDSDSTGRDGRGRQTPPERLGRGDVSQFSDEALIWVAAGGRTRGYGGVAVPVGIPTLPVTVTAAGYVAVENVGLQNGRDVASVTISAYTQSSTNAAGRVDNIFTGGRLVDVSPSGGPSIPFRLERRSQTPIMPESPGGTRDLDVASVVVPAGRAYRVELDIATNTPERSPFRHLPATYEGSTFTAVAPRPR